MEFEKLNTAQLAPQPQMDTSEHKSKRDNSQGNDRQGNKGKEFEQEQTEITENSKFLSHWA